MKVARGVAPAVATGAAAAAPTVADDEEDEKLCRYCFDDEEYGELLAPCDCAGGQKWVHLSCLRRWQRMVLVTTHGTHVTGDTPGVRLMYSV